MVEIVGRSTFGNVAGSAPVSLAVACTVCGALSKLSMLMCIVIRIGQNLGRNLLIFNVAYPSYAKDHYGKPNVQAHTSRQCCRNVLSCAGKKRRKFFLQLFMLPFCTITFLAQPFCAVFQLLGGSHIRCVVVACFTEAVSNWTVIQFSNLGRPPMTFSKTKEGSR